MTVNLSDMVSRVGRLPSTADPATPDPDLLGRFLADRDDQAFAQIVRRHGPMVFGVCRRITGNHHLAEDAFQAVFVVLAAKAGSVRPRAALPAWLYGVAYRTALRARTMSDRRRRHEALVGVLPEAVDPGADPTESTDVAAVLDSEIARLPEHLRAPVVLCELEGRSRQEAARRLGIPEGTLSSRLAAARKALAIRLRCRGVALSAAGLTAAFGQVAAASVPPDLTMKAVAAAVTPGAVSAPVATLSNGVLRVMFAQKLKTVPVVFALIASAAFTGGLLFAANPPASPTPVAKPVFALADPPKPAALPAPVAGKPLPKGPNKLLFYRAGHLVMIDPDGKNDRNVSQDRSENHPGDAKLSPDGKQLAVLIPGPLPPDDGTNATKRRAMLLHVRGLDEKEPGIALGVECMMFVWSPDGAELACSDFVDGPNKATPEASHFVVNVKTKEKTNLKLPDDHIITDWSRDGKFFLTTRARGAKDDRSARLYLMNRDGSEHKALTPPDQFAMFGKLSPSGDRILHVAMMPPADEKGQPAQQLSILDVATGKTVAVADTPLNGFIMGFCWSPDGKRIAYTWRETHVGKLEELMEKETESFLVVSDPDGKNAKTIATEKGRGQWVITIGHIDWR